MPSQVRIATKSVTMTATLNASKTAEAVAKALPIASTAERWGDEVYFSVPVEMGPEDAQAKVPSGTVAYWPEGPALCIFFGQTPYSPVNVVGTLDGDAKQFAKVAAGEPISVEKA